MSQLQVGRLILGPAWTWHEAVGDPITNLGGAPIPAPRQAIRHQVAIATLSPDGSSDTVAARLALRRQLRSMFNNTPLKIQNFFYVQYSDDLEQNGWYIPDFGQLVDIEGSVGLASGVWKLEQVAWLLAGHKRTHREARNIWMKDLRTGLPWRDTLKLIFSTDFSALPNIPLTVLPPGALSIANAVNGFVAGSAVLLPAGRDGGRCVQCAGPVAGSANNFNPDLACLAFDRTDANQSLGDVVVYDRRGNLGPFYRQAVLDDNPTAYWRLGESGNQRVAVDQMGTLPPNLLTNPNFESDTAGWQSAGTVTETVAASTTQVHDGSQSMLVQGAATLAGQFVAAETLHTVIPAVPNATYAVAAWVWYPTLAGNVSPPNLAVRFYDSGGVQINGDHYGGTPPTANTWSRMAFTITAPANAAYVTMLCNSGSLNTNGAATITAYWDSVMIVQSSTIPASFYEGNGGDDGDYIGSLVPNLLSNPSFESGLTSWLSGNGTAVSSSSNAFSGTKSVQITATATFAQVYQVVSASPGQTLTLTGYVMQSVGTARQIKHQFQWLDVSNNVIRQDDGTAITPGAVQQRLPALTATAPAGTVNVRAFISVPNSVNTDVFYFDAYQLTLSSNAFPYSDTQGVTLGQSGAIVGDTDTADLFDGQSGYVGAPMPRPTTAVSVEAWVYPTTSAGGSGIVVSNQYTSLVGFELGIDIQNLGTPRFGFGTYAPGWNEARDSATVVPNQWYYLVGTYDGATLRLYKNGALVASQAYAGGLHYDNAPGFIGRRHAIDVSTPYFPGLIDEPAVYNYALSASRIGAHYTAAVGDGGDLWEEAYGSDYPWFWTTGGSSDCPVIENGLTRVRWDGTNTPGFRVDVWDTSGTPGWAEQGKIIVQRRGDTTNLDDTWVAAGIHTEDGYTFDRSVLAVVMSTSSDTYSRERIFITMNRGQFGVTFECYPALKSNGTSPSDVALIWQPFPVGGTVDSNDSVLKIDGQGSWSGGSANSGTWTPSPPSATQTGSPSPGKFVATAGLGSALFSNLNVGAANFNATENWVALLRCNTDFKTVYPWQVVFTTQQAFNSLCSVSQSGSAYGGAHANQIQIVSQNGAGYVAVDLGFTPATPQQVLEGELMTLGTGTTSVSDSNASNALAAQNSQTADTHPVVTQANWPNSFLAQYRVFARVRVIGTQAKFYAKTGATTGTTVTVGGPTTPVYQWVDLGDILANNTTLEIHGWISSGTGSVDIDRIEAVLTQDRTRNSAIYSGARDNGLQELFDSRTMGTVVAR